MVGRFEPYEGGARFTRSCGPARGQWIEVFPHGKLDVKAELETLIRVCDEPGLFGFAKAGLRGYNNIHAGIGETHEPELVSRDYDGVTRDYLEISCLTWHYRWVTTRRA